MQRKLFLALFLAAFVPTLVFAAGKIRGKVTDAGTGEPLVGANVVIVGTQMGAASNIAGEYVILNVPVGTYTLKTSYVGYQSITVSNIRVNSDLTSEQNFALPGEGVTVAQVEIVAERPLINKSATNAVRIVDSEFFDKIPARGVNAAIIAQPAVDSQGGNIYIRGGRPDEVGYRVEGVSGTDVVYGGNALYTTAEAIEQLQVQAGGFSAEFGGANAGIVNSQLKSGGSDRWKASLLTETDNFTKMNKKALGGYSYGYADWTGTFGGPILGKTLRFFGSFQNTFQRDRNVSVREPYTLKNYVTDAVLTPAHPTTARPDTIPTLTGGGNTIGGMDKRWAFSGTLTADLNNLQIRGAGSYSIRNYKDGAWYAEQLNTRRLPLNRVGNGFGNVKISYIFNPTTFLEVNGNYFASAAKNMDPDFQDNLYAYGDSAANAALGYGLYRTGQNYAQYTFFKTGQNVSQPGRVQSGYGKNSQSSIGGRADFTTQMSNHELKIGGEYTRYTIRRYNPSGVLGWAALAGQARNPSELEDLLNSASGAGSDIIGYDIKGNEVTGDVIKNGGTLYLGPRHPTFMAVYAQDKIEFSDIILNLGLRWDYIDPNSFDTENPGHLAFNAQDLLLSTMYKDTKKTSQISPRIGFSFPVSDRTVFHAQYGKFIQQSRLNDSYRGAAAMSTIKNTGLWVTNTNGWGLLPERTTQYEVGISQVLSDNASVDITAFYKDISDQIQFALQGPDPALGSEAPVYQTLANSDFSTSKGIEVKFILRRTNRLSAQFNYTFMDSRSTASNPTSSNGIWQLGLGPDALPKFVLPTDFNFAHSGTLVLDYRYGKNDGGPVLQQSGVNLLFSFNSGHSYTLLDATVRGPRPGDQRFRDALEPPGASTTPWFFQLDARIDKAVTIAMLDVDFYIYVTNLLGTDNPVDAFFRNGDTRDDGWFATSAGQTDAATLGPRFVDMYRAIYLGGNSGNFGPPRQIRFGLKLEL